MSSFTISRTLYILCCFLCGICIYVLAARSMVGLVDFKDKLFEGPVVVPTYGTVAPDGLSWSDISKTAKKL